MTSRDGYSSAAASFDPGSPGAGSQSTGSQSTGDPWWHGEPNAGADGSPPGGSTEALLGVAVEEFVKIAGAAVEWANRSGVNEKVKSVVEQAAQALDSGNTCDPRICGACPVCQGLTALQTARPELAESLIEVMAAIGELVHAVADTLVGPSSEAEAGPPDFDQA